MKYTNDTKCKCDECGKDYDSKEVIRVFGDKWWKFKVNMSAASTFKKRG